MALSTGARIGPYEIVGSLGAGGMGEVYRARDTKLGRDVAIKILPADVIADPERRARFDREARLLAALNHPHIAAIFGFQDDGDFPALVLELVEGLTLAERLATGPLPIAEALEIARQIAEALEAAHESGIVHRDLKPANIKISPEGRVKVLDFGLAKAMTGSAVLSGVTGELDVTASTHAGVVVGTLAYMSPEQARGKSVDRRTDIWSFGCVLYEMLTGRRVFDGETGSDLIAAVLEHTPNWSLMPASTPPAMRRLLERCLDKDPRQRLRDIGDAAIEIDEARRSRHSSLVSGVLARRSAWRFLGALVLIGAAATAWRMWTRTPPSQSAASPRAPVVVLVTDFDNRTGDSVFDGTLQHALTLATEEASFVSAYPRASALAVAARLKPGTTRIDEEMGRLIAVREGIQVVLTGVIARIGPGYEIGVRAVDPLNGKGLAMGTSSADNKAKVLEATVRVAVAIRRGLGDPLSATSTSENRITTTSLEAAREYVLAQDLAANDQNEEAIEHYRLAAAKDSGLGKAYSGMAIALSRLGRRDEAAALYKQALAHLDRMTDRERYSMLGTYYALVERDYEKAIETYLTLREKYPADSNAWNNLAVAYFSTLNFKKALEHGGQAVQIYPKNVTYRVNYALYSMYAGDFERSEQEARRAIELNPATPKAYFAVAIAALTRGDRAAATAAYREAQTKAGPRGASMAAIGLADIAMYHGEFAAAEDLLTAGIAGDEAARNVAARQNKYTAIAEVYAARGRPDRVADAGRRALDLGHQASVAVPLATLAINAGRESNASGLAAELSASLETGSRALARVIEAELLLESGRTIEAIQVLRSGQQLADSWLLRFKLGVAYVKGGHFAQALSEFELCQRRRGEAAAVFLDDVPTFRYLAPLPYWLARAQEGLSMANAAIDNYQSFLNLRSESSADPRVSDARQRLLRLRQPAGR